jgi:hypothetical protein
MAQDGFSALERFGAELEALFAGAPASRTQAATTDAPQARQTTPARASAMADLTALETELGRLLMEHGIVVRGHDVARVVGLMSGREVQWTE